jgi:hypothetical protein
MSLFTSRPFISDPGRPSPDLGPFYGTGSESRASLRSTVVGAAQLPTCYLYRKDKGNRLVPARGVTAWLGLGFCVVLQHLPLAGHPFLPTLMSITKHRRRFWPLATPLKFKAATAV